MCDIIEPSPYPQDSPALSSTTTLPTTLPTIAISSPEMNCCVCYQDIFHSEIECINSPICRSCTQAFIRDQILQSRINKEGQIRCPCVNVNCTSRIPSQLIIDILTPSETELLQKYLKFWENSKVEADPTIIWCPAPNCDGIAKITKKNQAICERCNSQFCSLCRTQHSSWQFCSTDSVNQWKSSHLGMCKKCPRCRYNIEKNGGCNHMTCTACKHEFCWLCKSDYINGCSAGKLCPILAFNKTQHWGQKKTTRAITKSIAYPIFAGLAVGGIGIGLGVAAVGAVTVLPYLGIRKVYRDHKISRNHHLNPYDYDFGADDFPHHHHRNVQNINRLLDFDDLNLPLPVPIDEFHEIPSNLYERYCTYHRIQFSVEMVYHRFHFADRINITLEQVQEYSERYLMEHEDISI